MIPAHDNRTLQLLIHHLFQSIDSLDYLLIWLASNPDRDYNERSAAIDTSSTSFGAFFRGCLETMRASRQ